MAYGFRLYSVRMVKGVMGSKPVPFEQCGADGKGHLSDWLERVLTELETHETLTKMPVLRVGQGATRPSIGSHSSVAPERGDPQVRWRSHTTKPTKILFEIQYGTVGRFAVAMAQKAKDDADISDKAASHVFRGILYLPLKGEIGVLALESIDNSTPVDIVHSWLARAAIHVFEKDEVDVAAMSPTQAAGLSPAIFKINFKQIANLPRLKKMVKKSNTTELVLRKMEISGSGKPTKEKIKLVNKVTTKGERAKLADWAADVVNRSSDDGSTALQKKKASLVELEAIVDTSSGGNVGGMGFNEGHVVVNDGTGRKKIGPDHLDQFFVYPINGDLQPSDTKFEREVAKEVVELKKLLGAKLDVS